MRFGVAVAIAGIAGVAAPARAGAGDGDGDGDGVHDPYLARLATTVRTRLDELVAAHAPKLVPPVPVAVRWKVQKLGSVELGAPLVALVAGELDGDRRAGELYAITPNEVIAFGFQRGRPIERGRVAFSGAPAVPASRDVVGTAVIEGGELVAATSAWATELHVRWDAGALVGQPGGPGFLVCPGERAQLVPGRNYFATGAYALRCRGDLVDREGHPLVLRGELATTNKLAVTLRRCAPDGTCADAGRFEIPKVGVAFELADVDRDGTPEVAVSEASAPGARDRVKVLTIGDDTKPRFQWAFAGGVAGLAAVDGDDPDDVAELIAAVRFPDSTRVDLWRLD